MRENTPVDKGIFVLLTFSLAACGENTVGNGAENNTSPVNASQRIVAVKENAVALPTRKYAELKREGFIAGKLQIVRLTSPTSMPDGAIAEGSPILGFGATKAGVVYVCLAPASGWKENWTEAEMANWTCENRPQVRSR
jgi:hypothetical protein